MRYYCHHCHTQMNADELLPEFTCPTCHSGFIEEIPVHSAATRRDSSLDEPSQRGSSDVEVPGLINARVSSDEFSDDNSDVEFLEAFNGPLAQVFNLLQPTLQQSHASSEQQSQQQLDPNTAQSRPQARLISRTVSSSSGRNQNPGQMHTAYLDQTANQSIADVLNDFITGVSFGTHYPEGSSTSSQNVLGAGGSGPVPNASRSLINIDFPLPFFLHSNPGDYAWGNAGFDAVITQLLNNLDGSNSGPPPMPKDQVQSLPTVKISDEQVKSSNLQCTVCMEDFQIGDSARQLPCEHFFHQECILPWLALHASCPICRKTFATSTNPTQNLNQNVSDTTLPDGVTPSDQTNIHPSASDPVANTGTSSAEQTSTSFRSNNNSSNSVTKTQRAYDYTEDDCD